MTTHDRLRELAATEKCQVKLGPWQQFVADYKVATGGREVLADLRALDTVSMLFEVGRKVERDVRKLKENAGLSHDDALRAAVGGNARQLAGALGHKAKATRFTI